MKTRSSSGVGQKIDLDFNIDSLRITDSTDDYMENDNSSILNSIKQKSTVSNDNPKINASVQSSKIRNLLNNLPE